ncbi:MAG: hypothetical protein ACTSXP_13565 [Promethearchaeota archaeon]
MNDESKSIGNTGDVSNKRIGVFVCNCGINIAGVVDCPAVKEFASKLDGVVHSETHLSYCTEAGAQAIQSAIEEHSLDAVVIAA